MNQTISKKMNKRMREEDEDKSSAKAVQYAMW